MDPPCLGPNTTLPYLRFYHSRSERGGCTNLISEHRPSSREYQDLQRFRFEIKIFIFLILFICQALDYNKRSYLPIGIPPVWSDNSKTREKGKVRYFSKCTPLPKFSSLGLHEKGKLRSFSILFVEIYASHSHACTTLSVHTAHDIRPYLSYEI